MRNRGQGDGDVQVTVRLRDAGSGRTLQQEQRIGLTRDQTALVVAEIPAPAATYQAEVEASYPPR
jgi:hypothetical protein